MKKILFLLTLLLGIHTYSQRELIPIDGPGGIAVSISGATNVNLNETHTYTVSSPGVTILSGNWIVLEGSITSQNATSVTIKWTSSGFKSIEYIATNTSSGTLEGLLGVVVNNVSMAPNIPTAPLIANQNCNNATLQRQSSPPGITWYWQGTNSNGTSTSNSNSTYSVITTGRYYLRARNSSGTWSTGASSIQVTMGTIGGTTWYADLEGDGLGDPNNTKVQCTKPSNYVSNNNDQCPTEHGGGNSTGCSSSSGFSNENYVYTITPQIPTTNTSNLSNTADAVRTITYYDGLGRAKQNIGIKHSNSQKDIVTHIEYDALGRQAKEYLPYVSTANNGYFKGDALIATNNYYKTHYAADINNTNPNPFSEKEFDNSPLNRVMKQAAPGYDWRLNGGKEIKFEYDTNTGTEVREYYVTTSYANNTYTPTLQLNTSSSNNNGYYNAGELYKTITKDENHTSSNKTHTTEEFKNKQGQVVLKRTYITNTTKADTYYVYDDFGNLTYVLSPKAKAHNDKPDSVELSELCYQYKYDHRNRLVEKKIPGKGWEYIVYDKLDRPVLTQDAVQKNSRKWLFTKYDALGRVVYTGVYTHTSNFTRTQMQTHFNTINNTPIELYETKQTSPGSLGIYYSNSDFPTSNIEVLTVNYYDNYTFNRAGTGTSVNNGYGVNSTNRLKGLATGLRVKVLGTNDWITTVTYYDEKARPIYVYTKNDFLLSTDIVKSKLDFTGRVLETTTLHTKTDDNLPTLTLTDKFYYDHVGRLTKQTQHGTNISGTQVIVENTYDELGQLKKKDVGGKTNQNRLQNIDYKYNIRGWLKEINNTASLGNDLFAFKINYNTVNHGSTNLFNGNISETEWRTKNDNQLRWYKYSYDALNRISSAISNVSHYNLNSVAYDKNGNVTSLSRNGHLNIGATSFGLMDNLAYTYDNGNKLLKIVDSANKTYGFKDGTNGGNDYTYDANGNLTKDLNKGVSSISYNHLNLPRTIDFNDGGGSVIDYVYAADGTKLSKYINDEVKGVETIIQYAGNYRYVNGDLKDFKHPEGYVKRDGNTFNYVYSYKDHLGNIRLNYSDLNNDGIIQASTEILDEKNYYPFGGLQEGYNTNVTGSYYPFGFNGKEENNEKGLATLDFGARMYDQWGVRWGSIDPLAEKFNPISPYVYTLNNPVIFADPDGRDVILKIAGERLKGYKKFVSTRAGRAFVSQFLKKGDKIPGTNISIKESGKYANETLSFITAKVRKGKASIFYKNSNGKRGRNLRNVDRVSELQNPNSNYELAVYLEKSNDIKSDEYAVIIGHESFVHHSESLDKIDAIRSKTKKGGYKNAIQLLTDIIGLAGGADKDHVKLSKDQIKLFINMVKELDKKERTKKYTKMYEKNRDSNK